MAMKDIRNKKYPLKHLSMRVPWHDNGWNGTVCNNPKGNDACLVLKNCALNRDDLSEQGVAGKSLKEIEEKYFPACKGERGVFMSPFAFSRTISHPYADISKAKETHGKLKPTLLNHPAYSAQGVPFRWMFKDSAPDYADIYDLDYNIDREPVLDFKSDNWIQEHHNQRAMLDTFFGHIESDNSLVFFYAKQVPFVEASGRVLVGVGRVLEVHKSGEYEGSGNPLKVSYWEHNVLHSIRPDCRDGFLLPYHEALIFAENNPEFDPAEIAVIVPHDKQIEFSYATEHVGSDTSIRVLLSCIKPIEKAKEKGIGSNHDLILSWIHDRIQELEKIRGDYPGMGAALCAFGIEKGHFVAVEIVDKANMDKIDPWDLFQRACSGENGIFSNYIEKLVSQTQRDTYTKLKSSRRDLLHLLSRMDLSKEQAVFFYVNEEREQFIVIKDSDILDNPYLLYERHRYAIRYQRKIGKKKIDVNVESLSIDTIDFALYRKTEKKIYPQSNIFSDPFDKRRIRALMIKELEVLRENGHTLYPEKGLVFIIRNNSLIPTCQINSDYLNIMQDYFEEELTIIDLPDEERAYQLKDLTEFGSIISEKVNKRIKAGQITFSIDWVSELHAVLGEPKNEDEIKALEEKENALKTLSGSKFSILIGSAGTGKTTLLSIFAKKLMDSGEEVLFLAPTGKARVRMQEAAKTNVKIDINSRTIAQYLNGFGRFDNSYILSEDKDLNKYGAVIIDESSMLTEEMLGTVLDCLKDAKRIILVGDHRQLPPIGAGKPFIDTINHLKKEEKGLVELKINFRQKTENGIIRDDMLLANYFGGDSKIPNSDSVFEVLSDKRLSDNLCCIRWSDSDDFDNKFSQAICSELKLSGKDDISGFNISLGATTDEKGWSYFNIDKAVEKIEDWQILSPVRGKYFGVKALNHFIHKQFRSEMVKQSSDYRNNRFPYPFGTEQIVYGDKVINCVNQRRYKVWAKADKGEALNYIANGEIGSVVGQVNFKGGNKPGLLNIDFSTQKGFSYTFYSNEFGDEKQASIELAYALTVHKSQGSEFGMVFIVIPDPCFLLSRELLYTALTRQKSRVVLFLQGDKPVHDLMNITNSEISRRLTNLYEIPQIIDFENKYLDANLIHQASDGKMLRSKSELLIYEKLLSKRLDPLYEKSLIINGQMRLPDFTIIDADSDLTYYWEHWGMMHVESYRKRREEKIEWYKANGILQFTEGKNGENGVLIESYDTPCEVNGVTMGAISSKEIDKLIKSVFGV